MKDLQHLAIIMDGNGRWAQQKGHTRTVGHIQGVRVAKKIISYAQDLGIKQLTLFAFSSENWARPSNEVQVLMRLLFKYLIRERASLSKKNIRFRAIGQIERLPQNILLEAVQTMESTKNNTGMTLNLALSYSGRSDLIQTFKKIHELILLGKTTLDSLSEDLVSSLLETEGAPDPDLIIRTSGEQRLSNFLLWQSAYSELYFTNTLWPDFKKEDLVAAIQDYSTRERRFGKVKNLGVAEFYESNSR